MQMNKVFKTLRGRMLAMAIGVEVLMLTVLILNSMRLQHNAMVNQARLAAEQVYPVLKASLTAPVIQQDFATVQAIIKECRAANSIEYIVVSDKNGKVIAASGWAEDTPLPVPTADLNLFSSEKSPRYDVMVAIDHLDQQLGNIHFGLNMSQVVSARRALMLQGIGISILEVILSSLILLFIGLWITRHLARIIKASQQVASGNLAIVPVPEGEDDIGQLGTAFNTMSRAITERVNELIAAKSMAEANELAVHESEERLKLAMAGADMWLWDWHLQTNEFIYNQSVLGFDKVDLDSNLNALESLIHPDDLQEVHKALELHLIGRTPLYETEHRCRTKNGEWRWILNRGRVVEWSEDGTPVRAAGTYLDITDRKNIEDKLQKLNDQLELRIQEEVAKNREKDVYMLHQDKMASLGQLAAGIAHEINNPMAFVSSNLNVLKGYVKSLTDVLTAIRQSSGAEDAAWQTAQKAVRSGDLDYILEDIGQLVAESSEGAERVKGIVRDLKDFARADENSLSSVDLNQCVHSTLNIVRNEIKYIADIELNLGELPDVICSAGKINQVIANLLLNAAHSIEKHGTITITTSATSDHVRLEIRDNGCGMPEEVCKRVFEPFFTTKEVGKGTGLGLTISYGIIKSHGGEISIESTPGHGSAFTVLLPLAGPDLTAAETLYEPDTELFRYPDKRIA